MKSAEKKRHRHHHSSSRGHRHHSKKSDNKLDQSVSYSQQQILNDSTTNSLPVVNKEFTIDEMRDMVDENYYEKAVLPIESAKRVFVESLRSMINQYVDDIEKKRKKPRGLIFNSPNFSNDFQMNEDSMTNQSYTNDETSQSTKKDNMYNFFMKASQQNISKPNLNSNYNILGSDNSTPLLSENNEKSDEDIFNDSGSESGEIPPINIANRNQLDQISSGPDLQVPYEAASYKSSQSKKSSARHSTSLNRSTTVDPNKSSRSNQNSSENWSSDDESKASSRRGQNSPFAKKTLFTYGNFDNGISDDNDGIIDGII